MIKYQDNKANHCALLCNAKPSNHIIQVLGNVKIISRDERKIVKSISSLENASKKQLFIADLFLFYIFSNCDDISFLDEKKSQEYKNKCKVNFSLQMMLINNHNKNLHKFLIDYDLISSYDYLYDLLYFLLNGKFYDWKINDNTKIEDSLRKDLCDDFYEGFND